MLEIHFTAGFWRDYYRLPREVQRRADHKIELFALSPRHPSLRLKRVRGSEDKWEISITMQYRATLVFVDEDHAVLLRIGTHKVLDRP